MALTYYPDTVADPATGNALSAVQVTVWTAQTGGTQITALTTIAGTALPGYVTSDSLGRINFRIAADTWPVVWMRDPSGNTWPVAAIETLASVSTAVTQAAAALTAASSASAAAATAITTATAADARSTVALADAQAAQAVAQDAAAAAGQASMVDGITFPLYIAHRGGRRVHPEGTVEGFRAAAALQGDVALEPDVYATYDNSLCVMHDATVDRTTTSSGSTAQLTAAGIHQLRADPAAWPWSTTGPWFPLPGWPSDLHIPDFKQMLREFGGRKILVPQAGNTGSGPVIVDAIVRAGLQRSVILQAAPQADLTSAIANNIETMRVSFDAAAADLSPPTLAAAGVGWVAVKGTVSTAFVNSCHANGIKVIVWTVNRRVDRDAQLAKGVDGFFSDDPWYLSGTAPRLSTDPFNAGTYYHGHIEAGANWGGIVAPRGLFSPPWFSLDVNGQTGSFASILLGGMCPIKGQVSPVAWTLDFTARNDANEAAANWHGVFISATDASLDTTSSLDGYHVLFRWTGQVEIYRYTGGVGTKISTDLTTLVALAIGASRTYRIVVTATSITASMPAVASPNSVSVTDATYRGGYLHLTTQNSKTSWSAMAIT